MAAFFTPARPTSGKWPPQGDSYLLDLRAGRLGSLLDSVLTILDSKGNRLATCDDMARDKPTRNSPGRFRRRPLLDPNRRPPGLAGGPQYAYRLKIDRADHAADFQLKLPVNALNVERGSEADTSHCHRAAGRLQGPRDIGNRGIAGRSDGRPLGTGDRRRSTFG